MVEIYDRKLVITLHAEDGQLALDQIRESIMDATTILIESDEFYNNTEATGGVTTLVRFNAELV